MASLPGGSKVQAPERVLFIMVDTLRPDHLGAYGYDRPTSPTMDELAREGVVFTAARSTSSWTKPAIASLFTGVGPLIHGVEKGSVGDVYLGTTDALSEAWDTLPELFRRHGFSTFGVTANPHVTRRTGLGQGFDQLLWRSQGGEGVLEAFLAWLDAPYELSDEAWRRYRSSRNNLAKEWRQDVGDLAAPGISLEWSDSALLLEGLDGDAKDIVAEVSIPLVELPAAASSRQLLFVRARLSREAKARVVAMGREDPHPLQDLRSSPVEDLRLYVIPVDGAAEELCLELEVKLGAGERFELHEAILVPEHEVELTQRWFGYLHFMHPHLPYFASTSHRSRFPPRDGDPIPIAESILRRYDRIEDDDLRVVEARYDAAINQVDEQLGKILERLRSHDLLEGTLVVVASDHGEEFLDHGGMGHGQTLHEEMLRIPLILSYPAEKIPRGRIPDPVTLLDLFPTFVDLMGWEGPRPLAGASLMPLITGTTSAIRSDPFFFTHTPMVRDEGSRIESLIWGGSKLIRFASSDLALYDLVADPQEQNDLAAQRQDELERLEKFLDEQRKARESLGSELGRHAAEAWESPDAAELLRYLGYVE